MLWTGTSRNADYSDRFRAIGEKAVQRRHHLRALADRAADPLDRSGAHVADREHAGHRGFQRRHRSLAILSVLNAGQHEAGAIDLDAAAVEPAGGGIGADEQEQIADIEGLFLVRDSRLRQRTRSARRPSSPSRPTTSALKISSMFGVASMRSIR